MTESSEEQGEWMRIDNKFFFIKYMKGTNDKNYKRYIKKLLNLDWKHYKLYLIGGILEGWETIDIDIIIIGEKDKYLVPLMKKARTLGPFDISYSPGDHKSMIENIYFTVSPLKSFSFRAKTYDRLCYKCKPFNGEWIDDLYWTKNIDFTIREKYKTKKNTKKPLLIN